MTFKKLNSDETRAIFNVFDDIRYDNLLDAIYHGFHGETYADSAMRPNVVISRIGWNYYLGGDPDHEHARKLLNAFEIRGEIHASKRWLTLLETTFKDTFRVKKRYKFTHETIDYAHVCEIAASISSEYSIVPIDAPKYHRLLTEEWGADFVCNFKDYSDFESNGFGFVVKCGDRIAGGISSYIRFPGGYEIEIITHPDYRRRGLALIMGAHYVKACLEQGMIPHWDAAHEQSRRLAERLGYELAFAYDVYCV